MNIHVRPRNLQGSIEHYYHFLYGYLFPFIQYHNINGNDTYYFNDCGPVINKIITELPGINTGIINNDTKIDNNVQYFGFDNGKYHNINIQKIKSLIEEIYHIDTARQHFVEEALLIDRDIPHEFYHKQAKIKGSGSSRRHIPNIDQIHSYLLSKNMVVKKIFLEHLSLLDQINLFNTHRIIVAQHGASMSNLIWCKPQTKIIEIRTTNNSNCFNRLINLCQLEHKPIIQQHRFAPVNPENIYKAICI